MYVNVLLVFQTLFFFIFLYFHYIFLIYHFKVTTEEQIKETFSNMGYIENVNVVKIKSKTIAFLCFKEIQSAQKVLQLLDTTIDGAAVNVVQFKPRASFKPSKYKRNYLSS